MSIEERIQQIDIEIEAVERAIEKAMAIFEKEDLIKSVTRLQQQRKKLIQKDTKY